MAKKIDHNKEIAMHQRQGRLAIAAVIVGALIIVSALMFTSYNGTKTVVSKNKRLAGLTRQAYVRSVTPKKYIRKLNYKSITEMLTKSGILNGQEDQNTPIVIQVFKQGCSACEQTRFDITSTMAAYPQYPIQYIQLDYSEEQGQQVQAYTDIYNVPIIIYLNQKTSTAYLQAQTDSTVTIQHIKALMKSK